MTNWSNQVHLTYKPLAKAASQKYFPSAEGFIIIIMSHLSLVLDYVHEYKWIKMHILKSSSLCLDHKPNQSASEINTLNITFLAYNEGLLNLIWYISKHQRDFNMWHKCCYNFQERGLIEFMYFYKDLFSYAGCIMGIKYYIILFRKMLKYFKTANNVARAEKVLWYFSLQQE